MSTIGRYTALAKVADGGMAEIFLAVQRGARGFERKVILKRVRPEVAQDSELLKALHDEARIAMGLSHSNIAQVLDVGEAQGRTFLVLELVDGWSLSQLIKRAHAVGQTVPWAMSLFITAQLCRALSHAHGYRRDGQPLHIVHRDLSPQNVLLSAEGEVKLTDFGIARAESREVQTKVGLVKGKPGYMSPEQARGEPLDARSDLFALGVVLYELCVGKRPFRGSNDYEVLVKVQAGVYEPPQVALAMLPAEVAAVITRAMAADRAARYASADELLADLESVQRSLFGAAGQTELKAWMAQLAAADGQKKVSERMSATSPEPGSGELVSEVELVTSPSDERALMELVDRPPPAPRTARWPALLVVLAVALGAVVWLDREGVITLPAGVLPRELWAEGVDAASAGTGEVLSGSGPALSPGVAAEDGAVTEVAGAVDQGALVPTPDVARDGQGAVEVSSADASLAGASASDGGEPDPRVLDAQTSAASGGEPQVAADAGSAGGRPAEPGASGARLADGQAGAAGGLTASGVGAEASADASSPDAWGPGARSTDARSADARSADARSADARSPGARSVDAGSGDGRGSGARVADAGFAATRPATRPGAAGPAVVPGGGALDGGSRGLTAPGPQRVPATSREVVAAARLGSAADVARAEQGPAQTTGRLPSGRDAGGQADFNSVRIVSLPPGAAVRVERTTFGLAPISIRFRKGLTFEVALTLKGYDEAKRRFTVRPEPGQVVTVRLPRKR